MMRTLPLGLVLLAGLAWADTTPRHHFNYSSSAAENDNWNKLDERVNPSPVNESIILCGQLANNGTIYLGPLQVGDATGANGEGASPAGSAGDTACNALDSATEATADAPAFTTIGFDVVAMRCKAVADAGTTGSGSNGVTFTARSAAADLSPSLTCTVATGDIDCLAKAAPGAVPHVANGATIAVKAVSTEDLSAMDGWCRFYIRF